MTLSPEKAIVPDEHYESHAHAVWDLKWYFGVFAVLMVLLGATVGAAFFDVQKITGIPGLNFAVMLGIAVVKAALVVMVFMNVVRGSRLVWLWAGAGFVWFIMLFFAFMDYLTRNWSGGTGTGWGG